LDATPLQTAHRHHGIGYYTAGLLDGLMRLRGDIGDVDSLGLLMQPPRATDLPLVRDLTALPGVEAVPMRQPRWHLGRYQWLANRAHAFRRYRYIRFAVQSAHPRLYHATDPHGLALAPGIGVVATL